MNPWYPNKRHKTKKNIGVSQNDRFPVLKRRSVKLSRGFSGDNKVKKATPPWITKSQRKDMAVIYAYARHLSKITGIDHEVDHIIPLASDSCCGLHVPWNLRVVTKGENQSKRARIIDITSPWCVFPTPISH